MAATAASAASSKAQPVKNNKRKQSVSDMSDSESDSDSPSNPTKLNANGKVSASQQLVPVPGQPDAPLVTKRTLQNRKAQREFRKRREARVRELEERCRRFDQMGLEANSELQRLARRLKDENEALKSLIARLGFAHMIPGIMESLNGQEQQQQHHPQHHQFPHNAPPHHPQSFGPGDLGMDAWARASGVPASMEQMGGSAATANKRTKRPSASTSTTSAAASTSAPPISSLTHMPAFTELLPADASGVNPSLLSDARRNDKNTAAIAVPATNKSSTTARPIEDNNNSTFDNDWFAQLAQSGHDKDDADVEAAPAAPAANKNSSSMNPILSLNLNNSDPKPQSKSTAGNNTGSAMLGSTPRPFGTNLANALGLPANATQGSNIFPMPMPTQQNGALLNPNPIPFAFNLSENKAPGDQSWWSQVAGNTLDGDDSVLDEKAQAVAQATGAASPFDLSAFLNGGLTPGGGFTFGSQQTADDDANDVQKPASSSTDDSAKPNNGKSGEKQELTSAEHAQMFLRLLEAKMTKQSTSPYSQLGFQPPSHHQQYAASQAGPSFSDASSSGSSSSGDNIKKEAESPLSPINIYSRLAQHPAFLSTNASELEELVDSIGSGQRQQQKQRFQSPFNKRKATPTKAAPAIYLPNTGLTPSIYGPNGAAALQTRSPSSGGSQGGKDLEVDENAVTQMLGLLDRKTSRDAAASGLAF